MKRRFALRLGLGCLSLACAAPLPAADHIFQLVTNVSLVGYWPYDTNFTDVGFIGIPENVVSNQPAPGSGSAPNTLGSYTYINLDAMSVVSQAHTYTFLVGTMTLNDAGLVNTNVPFIKAAHFTGTQPYPGHGPMDLRLLAAYQDALAPETNALGSNAFYFSTRVDFQSVLATGVAVATNSPAAGFVILLNAAQFATNQPSIPIDTNNPNFDPTPSLFVDYVNSIVLPLARQRHPLLLICGTFGLTTPGSVPAGPASFPALSTQCSFVGMEFSSTNTKFPV